MDMPAASHLIRTPSLDQVRHTFKTEVICGSTGEHMRQVQTDMEWQPVNPALKRVHPKPTTSDKFSEHLLFDNLLFNSERVL
jgi:hypothetical protein